MCSFKISKKAWHLLIITSSDNYAIVNTKQSGNRVHQTVNISSCHIVFDFVLHKSNCTNILVFHNIISTNSACEMNAYSKFFC